MNVSMELQIVIERVNEVIWSPPFILLCIAVGLYFSFATRFLQIRMVKDMLQLLFKEGNSEKGVSPFQAFSMAIAGRVGTGNIAGVATAIAIGGPGAVFWMWMIAFFGSATAFIEATLGQIYKETKDGEYCGGPAFYIKKGMQNKAYALVFCLATIVSCALFLPMVQSNSIADAMYHAFQIDKHWTGLLIILFLGVIIIGGAKRIGKTAEIIVPFMAGAYIVMALVIIAMNISHVPDVFKLIFTSAFGLEPTFAGIVGSALAMGIKRGLYSNEAGQGTAPHAAAAAATTHPVKQGLVQAFSVYVDTLFVCTATALMILFTGSYNVYTENGKNMKNVADSSYIIHNLKGVEDGAAFTQNAISSDFPSIGAGFVAIALLFFAFTTIMAYYFIAESNFKFLISKNSKTMTWVLRGVFLLSVFLGALNSGGSSWAIGDIGVGLMAWINFIAILILRKPALLALEDYENQKKQGKDPVFNPEKLGIKNTTEW